MDLGLAVAETEAVARANALGTINPLKEIIAKAHDAGALVYIDAVHYAPHGPIDVQGLAPRARIRGFQSLSGLRGEASGDQTAQKPTASFK